jgi:hypothetical protein
MQCGYLQYFLMIRDDNRWETGSEEISRQPLRQHSPAFAGLIKNHNLSEAVGQLKTSSTLIKELDIMSVPEDTGHCLGGGG